MKFLIKLSQVLICVCLFLLISYVIDERDTLFSSSTSDSVSSNVSSTDVPDDKNDHNSANSEALTDENSHEMKESSDHTESPIDEKEVYENTEDDTDDHVTQEELPQEEPFNYEMEAIDKHSIGHLHEMKKIIDEFKASPHSNQEDLYNRLYTRNFMHLEVELEEKNPPLYNVFISLLLSVEEHNNFSDSESVIVILDEIYVILDNIITIE